MAMYQIGEKIKVEDDKRREYMITDTWLGGGGLRMYLLRRDCPARDEHGNDIMNSYTRSYTEWELARLATI